RRRPPESDVGDIRHSFRSDRWGSTSNQHHNTPNVAMKVGSSSQVTPGAKNHRGKSAMVVFLANRRSPGLFHGFGGDGKLNGAGDVVFAAAGEEDEDGSADGHDADGGPIRQGRGLEEKRHGDQRADDAGERAGALTY